MATTTRFFFRTAVFTSLILAGTAAWSPARTTGEASFSIEVGSAKKVFTRTELLAISTPITIAEDPGYSNTKRSYLAVPAYRLFEGLDVAPDAVVQFQCLDGFSASLPRDRLLSSSASGAVAWLAVEDPEKPWPPLKDGAASAGPFYLVWMEPQLSGISREEWPFQLSGFAVKGTLASVYPEIQPDAAAPAGGPVRRGLQVFARNCFACHKLNREGGSDIGPDLNVPMNPTEYLAEPAMRRLVRNPQDLRTWALSRMPAFGKNILSDADLDDLFAYLRAMAKRKRS